MLDENKKRFLEEAGPIFFVTPTMDRAIGLEGILPDYHIICAQGADGIGLMREAGAKVFCLGRDIKNSGKLLGEEEVIGYIKANSRGKTANIITFKPSPMLEIVCKRQGFRYLGNSASLNREWEDKVRFAEITDELGLKNANSRVVKIPEDPGALIDSFDFAANRRYVVQFSRGFSGNSTSVVGGKEELAELLARNIGRKAKIADFVAGDTYTLDACILPSGHLVSQPIFQITGFKDFNRNPLGTCGNDYAFPAQMDEAARGEIYSSIGKVAEKIGSAGYRGILGFDFVAGEDGAHIIEVNPRLVGSVPVYTKLQLSAGETPFLLLHILAFLGYGFGPEDLVRPKRDFVFSQLILRNIAERPLRVECALPSGVYRMEGGDIAFSYPAYGADQALGADEFFLRCAVEGEMIGPDMEYADIQAARGIMETRYSFKEDFLRMVDAVRGKITIR